MLHPYLWFIYALGAALLWGLQYAVLGQLLKTIPPLLLVVLYSLGLAFVYSLLVLLGRPQLGLEQWQLYLTWSNGGQFLLVVLVGCASTFLIMAAIAHGNATTASIVEITYPLFVAGFSALLYRETHLNWPTLLGGALTLAGVICVLYGQR
uniref:EamA domain-containing protein n=1 Tax=Cyanothece sp. (strain PCC 7425 / ATCC 29141) TaxID=395961 RepID=B8HTQ8_CYAP4